IWLKPQIYTHIRRHGTGQKRATIHQKVVSPIASLSPVKRDAPERRPGATVSSRVDLKFLSVGAKTRCVSGYRLQKCLYEGPTARIFQGLRIADESPVVLKVSEDEELLRYEFELLEL